MVVLGLAMIIFFTVLLRLLTHPAVSRSMHSVLRCSGCRRIGAVKAPLIRIGMLFVRWIMLVTLCSLRAGPVGDLRMINLASLATVALMLRGL